MIDRKTGKSVEPRATPTPAAPKPAETPKPAAQPQPEDGPPAPSGKARPSALQACPVQAIPPGCTTPPQARTWAGGACPPEGEVAFTDIRRQVPIPLRFSTSYFFAADETADDSLRTKGSDTLDVQAFYMVNDRLTVGGMARWLVTPDAFSLGPLVNYELRKETRSTPTINAGGFFLWGDGKEADRRLSIYGALSKEVPLPFRSNLLRGMRVHAGGSYNWREQDLYYDGWEFWLRGQFYLPEGFSIFVEGYRGCACDATLVAGLRWSSPWGVDFTIGLFDCVGDRIGFRDHLNGFPVGKRGGGDGSRQSHIPGHDSGQSSTNRGENEDDR